MLSGLSGWTRAADETETRPTRAVPEWAAAVPESYWERRRLQDLGLLSHQQTQEIALEKTWSAVQYDNLYCRFHGERSPSDAEVALQALRTLQSRSIDEDIYALGFFILEVYVEYCVCSGAD